MTYPQEGRYTKISAIAGVISLVIGFIALVATFLDPRPNPSTVDAESTTITMTSEPPAQQSLAPNSIELPVSPQSSQSPDESHPSNSRLPPMEDVSSTGLSSGEEGGSQPPTDPPALAKPTRACDALETATLRTGTPTRVASGLAVLSVRTAREGSEAYLTLTITSDRGALVKAVLGAPARFHFKTSLGSYFVNVAEADLAAGDMTVQVGCEPEENTP